ncbi:hypothetical protein [Pseudomonas sp. On1]|uniref:hypothetical protein n=1 Tax=Pseudomonas sp. On1 TaxID=3083258 RepID=UPI0029AE9AC3|nr:hypothetical protein [Pseudomonas sp. On1]MDX2309863.1 hypothetical protein [Pseudomonas sp. On1]
MSDTPTGKFTLSDSLPFSGKGKTPIADAYSEAERMLAEYRHALNDGVCADSDRYELICYPNFMGKQNVGVAYSTELQRVYLLFIGADRPEPDYVPVWLLDQAKELTLLARTLVVPDQPSNTITIWEGIKRGPIMSFRFKLADEPSSIKF